MVAGLYNMGQNRQLKREPKEEIITSKAQTEFDKADDGHISQGEVRKPPERTQEVLQEWEGVVERIEGDIFVARLRDMTADEVYPGEIAELPVADVSDNDRELLRVGAVFYMTVGYYVWADGRRERFGRVVFRRLPGWTASALERARERARRITRFLRPE